MNSIVAQVVSALMFLHSLDPKEKSAVSEEAENWPLKVMANAGQDRSESGQPWMVHHVPIG
jgi:hypothetical protein